MSTPKSASESGTQNRDEARAHEVRFCKLFALAIRKSGLTREQIAPALSERVGIRITVGMLNDYTATSKVHTRLPVTFLDALCEVLRDSSLHEFAAGESLAEEIRVGRVVRETFGTGKRNARKRRRAR